MGLGSSKACIYRDAVDRWFACGCYACCVGEQDARAEIIRRRFADDVYFWSGVAWKDYLFHVGNEHALLGIFFCHPLNPYTKFERFILEWLQVTATCCWIVLFQQKLKHIHAEKEHDEASPIHDVIFLYVHVTLPLSIVHEILRFIARESGRPDGKLERCCGRRCLCVVQWFLMGWWFLVVSSLSSLCYNVIANPGPWNNYGQDTVHLEHTYNLTLCSVLQGYSMWFLLDQILPNDLHRCPWTFGFWSKWRRERREADTPSSLHAAYDWFGQRAGGWWSEASSVSSCSSSSSGSGDEGGCCAACRH
mmetsp:Transcript_71729/g.181216  ORF Transcript_71729/g.181216 Transcript_71729/m.181216 type:complete len:306 (-) Transcript_71729:161-1078(-)